MTRNDTTNSGTATNHRSSRRRRMARQMGLINKRKRSTEIPQLISSPLYGQSNGQVVFYKLYSTALVVVVVRLIVAMMLFHTGDTDIVVGCCGSLRLNDDDVVSVDNHSLVAVNLCGYCNKFPQRSDL